MITPPDEEDLFKNLHPTGSYFNDKREFQSWALSADLRKMAFIVTVIDKRPTDRQIYIYNKEKGYYDPRGGEILRVRIKKILGCDYSEPYATATLHDITASSGILREHFMPPTHLVPMQNGLIDMSSSPYKLLKHSPKYHITNVIGYDYNPEAKHPILDRFLNENLTNEMARLRIQEWIGYLFYPRNIFQQALLLTGPPESGKSTFLDLLTALLGGDDNVVHLSLQELIENTFAVAKLDNKYACIMAELPTITIRNSGFIKALITGDNIYARDLYQSYRKINLRAKFVFAVNKIPFTYDTSDAFFKRWNIESLPNQFLLGDPKRDNNLIDKLIAERSGILNWALEGLERLLMNQNFTGARTFEETRQLWLAGSSNLYKYCKICVEWNPTLYEIKEEFHECYSEWCLKNNEAPLDIRTVGKQLPRIFPGVRTVYKKIGKHQKKVWKGIHIIKE